jgi:purine-binding chemotaxis protein CheW
MTSEAPQILRARALRLAAAPADKRLTPTVEVLEFLLAQETYAVESAFVREVHPLKDLTPLPGVPNYILGIVGIRGQIISIVDLKRFFDLPDRGLTDFNRLIVLESDEMEFGLLTDGIVGLRHIEPESIQSSPETLTGIRADFLRGVTANRCVVLDALRLLCDPRLRIHETVD